MKKAKRVKDMNVKSKNKEGTMFYVKKRIEVAGAHHLKLDYPSKCAKVHGHNWIITIFCKSNELNRNGMVLDFTNIKEIVMKFDHQDINTVLGDINPTAENMAKYLVDNIPNCYRAEVIESENNEAAYDYEEEIN
jgi:6-pyruvoyltetrahydropterin/6-carboxytetrahydropterin synthase